MIENRSIKQVQECKTLGVIVNQHLSWKNNTESICKKITSAISVIRKLKEFVDRDTFVSIFNAILQPYFTYCCEVWDIFGETQSQCNDYKSFKIDALELLWTWVMKFMLKLH
jgi:hypothetical protein